MSRCHKKEILNNSINIYTEEYDSHLIQRGSVKLSGLDVKTITISQ